VNPSFLINTLDGFHRHEWFPLEAVIF